MRPQEILDAINPHQYGLKAAAAACDPITDRLFTSRDNKSLIASIDFIQKILDPDVRDTFMRALIHYAFTGDREAAEQMIKDHAYLAANLHLGKHMHTLAMRQKMSQQIDFPEIVIDELPTYPLQSDEYEPAFTSELEILFETSMPSHAPDAAAKTRLQSVIY
jgi:hypothetical protein